VWPRAVSTLGRLKRLKSDIFEADFSSLGTLGAGETARRVEADRPVDDDDLESEPDSRRLVLDRPNRHREIGGSSGPRLRVLLVGCTPVGALYVAT
jgi:hypothetical protein